MGDPHAPLTADNLWLKFEDCVAWSQLKLDAKALFAQLQQLEKLDSAHGLLRRRPPASRKPPVARRPVKRKRSARTKPGVFRRDE